VELDEIMALSDRILVLYRGRIQGELEAAGATEEKVGILMAGGALEDLETHELHASPQQGEVKS
jgi:simple sugar transport system ATP-binding protein